MEQFVLDFLGSAAGVGAYGLVFGVLVACGLGLPLPEDVSLITGGYLAYLGQANLWVMLVVGFAGILVGDTIVFRLGRASRSAAGKAQPNGLLRRHLTPERIAKVEAQFAKRGAVMVVIARFLPGVRAATYFVAGSAQMSYARFILYDGLAALVSAPVFVLLGYHFGAEIGDVVAAAERFHTWLIAGMVVAAVGFLGWRAYARKKAAAAAARPEPLLSAATVAVPAEPQRQAERAAP